LVKPDITEDICPRDGVSELVRQVLLQQAEGADEAAENFSALMKPLK
jgi:hypothetical protein